jgi:hypothetical protein
MLRFLGVLPMAWLRLYLTMGGYPKTTIFMGKNENDASPSEVWGTKFLDTRNWMKLALLMEEYLISS